MFSSANCWNRAKKSAPLFGAKKIPEFAKGLGQGMKEFKKASREVQDELETAMNDNPPPPPRKITAPPPSEPATPVASEVVVADAHSPSATAQKH